MHFSMLTLRVKLEGFVGSIDSSGNRTDSSNGCLEFALASFRDVYQSGVSRSEVSRPESALVVLQINKTNYTD